jgi:hypothetical protein
MPTKGDFNGELLSKNVVLDIERVLADSLSALPIELDSWKGESSFMYKVIQMLLEHDIRDAQSKLKDI